MGQQSILHAVKIRHVEKSNRSEEVHDSEGSRPMNETLVDWQLTAKERKNLKTEDGRSFKFPLNVAFLTCFSHLCVNIFFFVIAERERGRAHFFVYCPSPCKSMQTGKLRVRCASCRSGAFTVDRDPQCWADVLQKHRITGKCEDVVCQVCT